MTENKKKWIPYALVTPSMLVMMLVIVIPIISTVIESFQTADGAFTLDNYLYFITSQEAFSSLVFTLTAALLIVLFSVLIGLLLALYMRFSNTWISKAVGSLYILPRFIPGIVAVYAVMNVIKDPGLLHRIALLFGVEYYPGVLYDLKGIVISNLWFNIPFATMMISAALSNVSDSYIESMRDVGGSSWDVFKAIIWPLIYKDIIVAATFILMSQIGAFTIPFLVGPNHPKMLGVLLYEQVNVYLDYNRAAALSVLMFIICLAGAWVYIRSNMKEEIWQKAS